MRTIITFFLLIIAVLPFSSSAQLISVSGFVYSSTGGDAVVEASIFESKSGIGTITDRSGYYKLLLRPGDQNFRISRTGYETFNFEFSLQKDTVITVNLKPKIITGSRLIVETEKKRNSRKDN